MDIISISNTDLISQLKRLVRSERKLTHLVLLHIIEMEKRKLHLELGFDRMFSYLTKELGYSEHAAYERIRAADLLKQIPEISDKIESGALNLTQLTEVQKCLREKSVKGEDIPVAKTREVLSAIEHQSGFATQKYLAQEFNLPLKQHEKLKPQKDESIRLEITFTKEEFAELQMAKELLSHACADGKWADVISTLAKKFNLLKLGKPQNTKNKDSKPSRHSSKKPAKALEISKDLPQSLMATAYQAKDARATNGKGGYRPYISVKVKRKLLERAGHHCEYKHPQTGRSCSSKFHLQVDHITPLALNGGHDISNLRILCGSHNRFQAQIMGLFHNGGF